MLEYFDQLWQTNHAGYNLKGKRRRLEKFNEHGSMSRKGSAGKLLFVLVYLKQNPTQCYQAFTFSMSQDKVSQWLKVLLPLLEQALGRMRLLPARTPGKLYQALCLLSGEAVYLDVTERAVPLSVGWERQRQEYSGPRHLPIDSKYDFLLKSRLLRSFRLL